MKIKRVEKILTSILLAFAMVLSFNASVYAATKDQTQNVTITELEDGTSVSVYKLIDLNIDVGGSIMTPMYSWTDEIQAWIKNNEPTYIDQSNDNEVTEAYTGLDDEMTGIVNTSDITKFYQKVASAIRGNDLTLTPVDTQVASGSQVIINGLKMGQYIALASHNNNAKKIYYPIGINVLPSEDLVLPASQPVAMKSKPVTIDKDVDDSTVEVGQIVDYSLVSDIPTYPHNVDSIHYVIGDKLSSGLTLQSDSIKVYGGSSLSDPLAVDTDYTLSTIPTDKSTFTIDIKKDYLIKHPGAQLKVTYSAKVNKDAVVGNENLRNDAYLEFNNDPFDSNHFTEIPTNKQLYTYTVEFTKVDNGGSTPLNGAQFTLSKEDGTKLDFDSDSDGNYTLSETQNGTGTLMESNNSGLFTIKGLATGSYTLKEVKSPSGYVLPNGEAKITLVDNDVADGTLDVGTKVDGTYECIDFKTNTLKFSFKVKNKKAGDFDLPVTGGIGTMIFTTFGLVLMAGALLLFFLNKKKTNIK